MHFGFRAMTHQPDQRLAELGLARIHHRLLYFIGRNPGCSVNELLGIMHVSKQYLNKPLKKMIGLDYVRQTTDAADRRIRRLQLTAKGKRLEFELTEAQRRRFARIFQKTGASAEQHWRAVMALLCENFDF